MGSAQILADGRAVEQLRRAMRDIARIQLAGARMSQIEAERMASQKGDDLSAALVGWNDALQRREPDPVLFGLAGNYVVRSEVQHKAALLDEKIAEQQCAEAASVLARAEAHLESSRMISARVKLDFDRSREEQAAREAEDAFGRRRRA